MLDMREKITSEMHSIELSGNKHFPELAILLDRAFVSL